jgi:hypothetical protein
MFTEPEGAARIIESQVVGNGSVSDEALCTLPTVVRTMEPDGIAISIWVKVRCRALGVDQEMVQTIVDAIVHTAEAE